MDLQLLLGRIDPTWAAAMLRISGVLLLLCVHGSAAAAIQTEDAPAAPRRLDSLLSEQATHALERYGDTFYILGVYLGSDGEARAISTRHWPALTAPPDERLDSLEVAFLDYRPQMQSAAYLVDRWRQLDSRRADSTFGALQDLLCGAPPTPFLAAGGSGQAAPMAPTET